MKKSTFFLLSSPTFYNFYLPFSIFIFIPLIFQKSQLIALRKFTCTWQFFFCYLWNSLTVAISIMICLSVGLLGFILFGILCASFLLWFEDFSPIISWNTFSIPFSPTSPSKILQCECWCACELFSSFYLLSLFLLWLSDFPLIFTSLRHSF